MPGIAPLSTGVIARIMNGEEVDRPVLQILGVKRIAGGDSERYRLLTSDGKYFNSYAMLATQLNHMHDDGNLAEYTIVRVDKYITSVVSKTNNGKRVLIMLELTVLNPGAEVGKKIGEPISYTEASAEAKPPSGLSENTSANKPAAKPAAKPDPKPSYSNTTLNSSVSAGLTHPISSLSPYQNKWVIKARVTSKSAIRTWSNARGEGKLFSFDMMDESGEIRGTAFKEQCDKFYDLIQPDRVYYISKCQLKPANKQFSTLKNDYEMTFTGETVVQLCEDAENDDIPQIRYDLVPISQVANIEPKAAVDTIGICKDVGELQTFTSRTTNKEFTKRDITLIDMSNAAVSLTLWGDDAVNFDGHVQPVVLVKGARVNEFNGGKSLSVGNGAIIKLNPDIPEGHKLRGWFDNGGGENITNMLSTRTGGGGNFNTEWLTIHEVLKRKLGCGDKPEYFQMKAIVHKIRPENAFYKACPQADCNKKVVDEGTGHFRCERCNATFPNFKYRLLLNMIVGDWTDSRWATCFSDVGEQLLQHTSQEVGEALEHDENAASAMLSSLNLTSHIFKMRCKEEFYGDVARHKMTIQSVSPINYKEYNKYLISSIKEIVGIGKA